MYAFRNDKSQWNLGDWNKFWVGTTDFIPGVASDDSVIRERFPDKFVCKYDIQSAGGDAGLFLKSVCEGIENPALLWAVLHNTTNTHLGVYGLYELTEEEQEDAIIIEDVFFQNEYIYIVASERPIYYIWLAIKGA